MADRLSRRDQLLDRVLAYLLRHGVAGLSLRPLGAAVGSSARLLIYHFGSKEGLLTAAMDDVRRRLQDSLRDGTGAIREGDPLLRFWAWATSREQLPLLGLLFEVQVLALRQPARYRRYLQRTSATWLTLVEASLPASTDRRTLATLCVAVVDGLLLELLATGDRRRTTDAIATFSALLHAGAPAPAARSRRKPAR